MTQTKGFVLIDLPMIVAGSIIVLLSMFCAAEASAQNPINGYIVGYYIRGATAPVTSTSIGVTPTLCGQAKQTSTITVDPTKVVWDDPSDATKDCVYTDPALVGTVLGYGPLDARLVACNGTSPFTNCSVPSNTAQFSRTDPRPPSTPANLRVVR